MLNETYYYSTIMNNNGYPNVLTPPSSSEDSPSSQYYQQSPGSSYETPLILPQTSQAFDFDVTSTNKVPYLKILEQPIDRFRFRYKSEMTGTHGSLCGQNSDRSRKQTYPTVQLCNYNKRATIRCSIYQVTRDDHRPHAHRLIRKQGKGEVDDPHDAYVGKEEGYIHSFHSMGIIHTAKKNLVPELVKKKTQLKKEEIARLEGKVRELTVKEEIEIKGLAEAESKSINLNVVLLRYDAFYNANGILLPICPPVYTHTINNLKSALTGELKIVRMDHCNSPAKGQREVFILVERVTKKNIKIRFYELDDDDGVVWEDYGKFSDLDVHHQYAIVFKTPPYRDQNIQDTVRVYIELERPSDRARSEPKEFSYTPNGNSYRPGAKRPRTNYGTSSSYESSLASDELPATINNLCINNPTQQMLTSSDYPPIAQLVEGVNMDLTSADLQEAMTNINSDEFRRLFTEFGTDYDMCTTDAPNADARKLGRRVTNMSEAVSTKPRMIKPLLERVNTFEEKKMAKHAVKELENFIKTGPTHEKASQMLNHYLGTENKTNALHISIREGEYTDVMFFLKMIWFWKQHHLCGIRNDYYETPLHIAVAQNSIEFVSNLMLCQANPALPDGEMNTALHLAVILDCSTTIFEKLFSTEEEKWKTFIDAENDDGNTAMNIAIENSNLKAVKLLCLNGADINHVHKKSGYTPLRFAIEKQIPDMISYILQHKDVNPSIEDFGGVTPLQAAMAKENSEVKALISDFMKLNDYENIEIKQENEDITSEDEIEEKYDIRQEEIKLEESYEKITKFTPECLDKLAEILDQSDSWKNLADLLDLGYLVRSGLYETNGSPTKMLLQQAVEVNGDTVFEIRNFLENLDETKAVEIIDQMVRLAL